jgi:hypothetical protein
MPNFLKINNILIYYQDSPLRILEATFRTSQELLENFERL